MINERKVHPKTALLDMFTSDLRFKADWYGLGGRHRLAELNVNLNPTDFFGNGFYSDLFLHSLERPNLCTTLWHLMDMAADRSQKKQPLRLSVTSRKDEQAILLELEDNTAGLPHIGAAQINASSLIKDEPSHLSLALRDIEQLGGVLLFQNIIDEAGNIQGVRTTICLPLPQFHPQTQSLAA